MDYVTTTIFAVVQAITEFVPISSSGHLVILHNFLPPLPVDAAAFDVVLHGGTLLAVLVFFYNDIKTLSLAWVQSIFRRRRDASARLAWLLLLATAPAGLAGYIFENIIENYLRSTMVVVVMLVTVGALFLLVEKAVVPSRDINGLRWPQAFIIGCAQALALVPGTSRSGITIIAGMATGLNREAAVRFSFLLAAPIVLGANLHKFFGAGENIFIGDYGALLGWGFAVSAVLGYLVIKYFIFFVKNHSLVVFSYYRFALALLLILFNLA